MTLVSHVIFTVCQPAVVSQHSHLLDRSVLLPLLFTFKVDPHPLLVRKFDVNAVTCLARCEAKSVLVLVAILVVVSTKNVERLLTTWRFTDFTRRPELGG